MDKREMSKKLYLESGIIDNAYNWHIWKRAFDLGSMYKQTKEKKTIEDRKALFKKKIEYYLGTGYTYDFLQEFFDYWTEHGEKDRKMRFEKQTSFDISRRLKTWKRNQDRFIKQPKLTNKVNDKWL